MPGRHARREDGGETGPFLNVTDEGGEGQGPICPDRLRRIIFVFPLYDL